MFRRLGAPANLLSRPIPFVGAPVSHAAGGGDTPVLRFLALATLGSIVWIAGLGVLGREVGSNWQAWRHHLEYVDYAGAALVVVVIVYLIRRARRGGAGPGPPVASRTAAPSEREPAADAVPD